MALIICIILLLSVSVFLVLTAYKYNQLTKKAGTLKEVRAQLFKHENFIEQQLKEKEEIAKEIAVAKETQKAAIELAEKQLELERERKLVEFNTKLDAECAELVKASPKAQLYEELCIINEQIETARKTLMVQQEQAANAAKEEDFINFHSIGLASTDLKDIELIREFSPKLTRQEAFFKLIWTEFYQKPIQALCKVVGAEKVCGIYKITNIQTQRMYIGQAIDIAARWKEHCKCGLGIGSTSYMTNKFYKALHKDGIESYTFEVLELCPKEDLNDREFYWIDFYNASTFGYNSKIGG